MGAGCTEEKLITSDIIVGPAEVDPAVLLARVDTREGLWLLGSGKLKGLPRGYPKSSAAW